MPAPFGWIDLPSRSSWMGFTTQAAYSIAKYPVTNAQYRLFVDAGGYEERKWWTNAGWDQCKSRKWTKPLYWSDQNWNGLEHPVVGISWYEALAFCLWLSEITGEKIVLPTRDQWQYAAQGAHNREYPWGPYWDASRCNNGVRSGGTICFGVEYHRGSGHTTPVWEYEGEGDSPFGVVDMAGNVWEWSLTDEDNKPSDINIDTKKRTLCGGSWGSNYNIIFCCRYHIGKPDLPYPRFRDCNVGFRIARI